MLERVTSTLQGQYASRCCEKLSKRSHIHNKGSVLSSDYICWALALGILHYIRHFFQFQSRALIIFLLESECSGLFNENWSVLKKHAKMFKNLNGEARLRLKRLSIWRWWKNQRFFLLCYPDDWAIITGYTSQELVRFDNSKRWTSQAAVDNIFCFNIIQRHLQLSEQALHQTSLLNYFRNHSFIRRVQVKFHNKYDGIVFAELYQKFGI